MWELAEEDPSGSWQWATATSQGTSFCVVPNTIFLVVSETCCAIVAVCGDEVMKLPATFEDWKVVAKAFENQNFSHAIGAIDGKHIC